MPSLRLARFCNGIIPPIVSFIVNLFRLYMYTAMPEKVNMTKVNFWNKRIKFNYHTVLKGSDRTNKENCMSVIGNFKAFCPHGQSVQPMFHVAQLHVTGKEDYFTKFDYKSTEKNMRKYGSVKPPSYKMDQITADIALYYGDQDRYITEENMELLRNKLCNAKVESTVLKDWGHGTFVLGENMGAFYRGLAE